MRKSILKKVMIVLGCLLLLVLTVEAALLFRIQRQIGNYETYWQERAEEAVPENALIYVALGDSVAQGIGASWPGKGYVGLIAESLRRKTGRPIRVINLSKSGARVSDALNHQVPLLKSVQPDVVTIGIGANDMAGWSEKTFRSEMQKLMAELPEHTVISDIPYFGGGRKRSLEKNVLAANTVIHELAARHGLIVAPLYETTKDNDGLGTLSADFLHPNNRGHRNWHEAFWQTIKIRGLLY
jgi:acyl-CoA thioesterase I